MTDIAERVRKIAAKHLGTSEVHQDVRLLLGIPTMIELSCDVDNEFGIDTEMSEFGCIGTVADLIRLVETKVALKPAA